MKILSALAIVFSLVTVSLIPSWVQASPAFGIKTGIAYYYALSDVTQVPITDAAIVNLYGRVKSRLPITGDFSELSEPVLFGLVSLAGQYCRRMVDVEMANANMATRLMTKGIVFTTGPKLVNEEARMQMLRDMGLSFWGRVPTDVEAKLLMEYLESTANALPDTGKSTQDWAAATCTEFASSLEFLLN